MEHLEKEVWYVDKNGEDQVTECVIYFIWNNLDEVAEIEKVEDEQGREIFPEDLGKPKDYFQTITDDYCWNIIGAKK